MLALRVSHKGLALLELSVVLGHEGGIDAAIGSSHHHHDAHDATDNSSDDHSADGPAHAHWPVPLLLGAGCTGLGLGLGPLLGLHRFWAGLGAGWPRTIQPS